MTVTREERAVKTEIAALAGRHSAEFCGDEVGFGDAVFFIEYRKNVVLDGSVVQFARTDKDVERFGRDRLVERLFALFVTEVRKQVVDVENGIVLVLADIYADLRTVGFDDDAVERERDRDPLIFTDTAVVVRLEESKTRVLIERTLFEVKARRVDVRDSKTHTVRYVLFSYSEEEKRFAAVVVVKFISGFELHTESVGLKSLFFREVFGVYHRFALGFRGVEEHLVKFGVIVRVFCSVGFKKVSFFVLKIAAHNTLLNCNIALCKCFSPCLRDGRSFSSRRSLTDNFSAFRRRRCNLCLSASS